MILTELELRSLVRKLIKEYTSAAHKYQAFNIGLDFSAGKDEKKEEEVESVEEEDFSARSEWGGVCLDVDEEKLKKFHKHIDIKSVQRMSMKTGVRPDYIYGTFNVETSGMKSDAMRAYAFNPQLVIGENDYDNKPENGRANYVTIFDKYKGPVGRKLWEKHMAAWKKAGIGNHEYTEAPRKQDTVDKFNAAYAIAPELAVTVTAMGFYQVLGHHTMPEYNNDPKALWDDFTKNPKEFGEKAFVEFCRRHQADFVDKANTGDFAAAAAKYYGLPDAAYLSKVKDGAQAWRRAAKPNCNPDATYINTGKKYSSLEDLGDIRLLMSLASYEDSSKRVPIFYDGEEKEWRKGPFGVDSATTGTVITDQDEINHYHGETLKNALWIAISGTESKKSDKSKFGGSWANELGMHHRGSINFHKLATNSSLDIDQPKKHIKGSGANYRAGINENPKYGTICPTKEWYEQLVKDFEIERVIILNRDKCAGASKSAASAAGLEVLYLPTGDNSARDNLELTRSAFDKIIDALDKGKTLITCNAGADRTGATVARYYMESLGAKEEDAFKDAYLYKSGGSKGFMTGPTGFIKNGPEK